MLHDGNLGNTHINYRVNYCQGNHGNVTDSSIQKFILNRQV